MLAGTAHRPSPSAKLRRRILASVGHEQRAYGWTALLAAAMTLSICAAVYFGGRERDFAQQATALRHQMGAAEHRADPPQRGVLHSQFGRDHRFRHSAKDSPRAKFL